MIKQFLVALMAVVCSLSACASDDQIIPFNQLPEAAQKVVKTHFDEANVAYCALDKELFGKEYKVRMNDGAEMEFESDGALRKIECKVGAVPEALVPAMVKEQIAASFPNAIITEWGKDDRGWKAELSNELELKFDKQLKLIKIDD